jgi:phage tail protein X
MREFRSEKGESLADLVYRVYGRVDGIIQIVWEDNPELCFLPSVLPFGTKVKFRDGLDRQEEKSELISLWE